MQLESMEAWVLMETRWRKEGLGFLEERYENSSFLLADTDVPHGFGL